MDQAAGFEASRTANVAGQAASDVWRGKGAKIAWESAAQREVPHDYGDEAAIAAQHAETMAWANKMDDTRVAKIDAQAASDVWRSQGKKWVLSSVILWVPRLIALRFSHSYDHYLLANLIETNLILYKNQ